MSQLPVIFKRELASYFATPLAYVFILIFLVLSGVFTFYLGGFYERGQADLTPSSAFTPGSTCSWSRRSPCACGPRSASPARSSC